MSRPSVGVLKAARKYLRRGRRVVRTTTRKLLGRSDYRKWSRSIPLEARWNSRTIRMAGMVPPGSRVLEFGAGRMVLREHLPPGCTYIPTDLVERAPGMLACDLNARRLPDLPPADVAVFSGVLEFVNDVPRALSYLRRRGVRCVVASYMTTEGGRPRQILERRRLGVVNDYTREEFASLFERCGFRPVEYDSWDNPDGTGANVLFKFERAGS